MSDLCRIYRSISITNLISVVNDLLRLKKGKQTKTKTMFEYLFVFTLAELPSNKDTPFLIAMDITKKELFINLEEM